MHDPLTSSAAEHVHVAVAARLASRKDTRLVRMVGDASEVGDQPPLFTICGTVLACGVLAGAPRATHAGAGMFGALLLATAVKTLVKGLISRTRPKVLLDETRHEVKPLGPGGGPSKSFPSGHTAGSVAVASAAVRAFPEYRWGFYGAAAALALAQVPCGAHYPADVIAGALTGFAAAHAAHAVGPYLQPRPRPPGEAAAVEHARAELGPSVSRGLADP